MHIIGFAIFFYLSYFKILNVIQVSGLTDLVVPKPSAQVMPLCIEMYADHTGMGYSQRWLTKLPHLCEGRGLAHLCGKFETVTAERQHVWYVTVPLTAPVAGT
jgi:hypothetical protein